MRKENRQKGFTMIEMIIVLVLVGILSAVAGLGIVTAMQGYLFSKDNATVSAKAQLAIARISRELLECYDCSGTSGASVAIPFSNTLGQRYIQKDAANNIVISDQPIGASGTTPDILLDNVGNFTMIFNSDKSITITIHSSKKPRGITIPDFVTKIYPRNT